MAEGILTIDDSSQGVCLFYKYSIILHVMYVSGSVLWDEIQLSAWFSFSGCIALISKHGKMSCWLLLSHYFWFFGFVDLIRSHLFKYSELPCDLKHAAGYAG